MQPAVTIEEIEGELARRSRKDLRLFNKLAWPQVEAGRFEHNWHLDAIADHLSAVSRGEIRRLIINMPPRHMKSLSCNVFWPSWDWIERPWRKFIFSSYRTSLSIRDNRKARKLVGSQWYQDHFEPRIDPGQDASNRWAVLGGGERLVTSVGGASSTGEGGDIIVVDDPLSADGARSEAARRTCIEWFDETMRSRLNDAKTGAFVVIMQRLHQEDLSGHLLANDTGWDHLCLPARYEPDHPHPIRSSLGFKDPRGAMGEVLHARRFGKDELDAIAKEGSYAEAGQLQQRPVPRGGGIFKRDWFETIPAAPAGCKWVRAWDLAASTEKDSAWTAGLLMGKAPDGRYVIADVKRIQGSPAEVNRLLVNTAGQDKALYGAGVRGSLPQDPGQAGKAQVRYLISQLAGFNYRSSPENGDKITRAEPLAAQAEVGNVLLVAGPWNKDFLDEIELFPVGKFLDQVDAASRAFAELVSAKTFQWYAGGETHQ